MLFLVSMAYAQVFPAQPSSTAVAGPPALTEILIEGQSLTPVQWYEYCLPVIEKVQDEKVAWWEDWSSRIPGVGDTVPRQKECVAWIKYIRADYDRYYAAEISKLQDANKQLEREAQSFRVILLQIENGDLKNDGQHSPGTDAYANYVKILQRWNANLELITLYYGQIRVRYGGEYAGWPIFFDEGYRDFIEQKKRVQVWLSEVDQAHSQALGDAAEKVRKQKCDAVKERIRQWYLAEWERNRVEIESKPTTFDLAAAVDRMRTTPGEFTEPEFADKNKCPDINAFVTDQYQNTAEKIRQKLRTDRDLTEAEAEKIYGEGVSNLQARCERVLDDDPYDNPRLISDRYTTRQAFVDAIQNSRSREGELNAFKNAIKRMYQQCIAYYELAQERERDPARKAKLTVKLNQFISLADDAAITAKIDQRFGDEIARAQVQATAENRGAVDAQQRDAQERKARLEADVTKQCIDTDPGREVIIKQYVRVSVEAERYKAQLAVIDGTGANLLTHEQELKYATDAGSRIIQLIADTCNRPITPEELDKMKSTAMSSLKITDNTADKIAQMYATSLQDLMQTEAQAAADIATGEAMTETGCIDDHSALIRMQGVVGKNPDANPTFTDAELARLDKIITNGCIWTEADGTVVNVAEEAKKLQLMINDRDVRVREKNNNMANAGHQEICYEYDSTTDTTTKRSCRRLDGVPLVCKYGYDKFVDQTKTVAVPQSRLGIGFLKGDTTSIDHDIRVAGCCRRTEKWDSSNRQCISVELGEDLDYESIYGEIYGLIGDMKEPMRKINSGKLNAGELAKQKAILTDIKNQILAKRSELPVK
ncbi:MAG: hypothetical protein ABH879_09135 [archaeon]